MAAYPSSLSMSKHCYRAQRRLARIKHRVMLRWKCKRCRGVKRVPPERGDEMPQEYIGWYWCSCGDREEYRQFLEVWRDWLIDKGYKVAPL